jgi:Sulfotransferase domain
MIIHIGGPKSGSTTLQRAVFSNLEGIYHFGEFGDGVTSVSDESVIRQIFYCDEQFYNEDLVLKTIEKHQRAASGRNLVFSSADVLIFNRPTLSATRLAQLFGTDSKILLIIRNQFDALMSYYVGHGAWLKPAPRPYFRAFTEFTNWFEYQLLNLEYSRLSTFSYWHQISPFAQIFDRENVHVIIFEELVNDVESAWTRLAALLGKDELEIGNLFRSQRFRERPSERQVKLGRLAAFLLPVIDQPDVTAPAGIFGQFLRRGRSYNVKLNQTQRDQLNSFYAEGNRTLADVFELDLASYGYPGFHSDVAAPST